MLWNNYDNLHFAPTFGTNQRTKSPVIGGMDTIHRIADEVYGTLHFAPTFGTNQRTRSHVITGMDTIHRRADEVKATKPIVTANSILSMNASSVNHSWVEVKGGRADVDHVTDLSIAPFEHICEGKGTDGDYRNCEDLTPGL